MKKITCLLAVAAFLNVALAKAQKCITRVDPFSNESVASFELESYGNRNLAYESVKDKKTLEFRAIEMGAVDYTILKGREILMKLDNGEIITLTTMQDIRSAVGVAGASGNTRTYSNYFLKAEISNEQLQKLAKSKAIFIKYPDLHGSDKSVDAKELGKDFCKALMEGAKCLLGIK